jgi:hypothetical protein
MHERSALPLGDKAAGISQMPLRASFRVADDTASLDSGRELKRIPWLKSSFHNRNS